MVMIMSQRTPTGQCRTPLSQLPNGRCESLPNELISGCMTNRTRTETTTITSGTTVHGAPYLRCGEALQAAHRTGRLNQLPVRHNGRRLRQWIYGHHEYVDTAQCFFAYLRQLFKAKGTNGLDITHTLVNTRIQQASAILSECRDDIGRYRFSAFWPRSKCSIW